ncbi:MAG: hypothetical protein ACPGQL_04595 [Thermoplasmatota archaeon]
MQKVDIAIAVVGVVAVVATLVGIATYEDGANHYTFPETTVALAEQTGDVGASPVAFQWEVPANAIGASFTVVVDGTGQAIAGGSGTINVLLTGPDGSTETATGAISFGPGAGSAQATITIENTWGMAPEELDGTQADADAKSISWDMPIIVEVSAEAPSGPLAGNGFAFTATLSGEATAFEAVQDTPDAESA